LTEYFVLFNSPLKKNNISLKKCWSLKGIFFIFSKNFEKIKKNYLKKEKKNFFFKFKKKFKRNVFN
jgi:hypothetical protein